VWSLNTSPDATAATRVFNSPIESGPDGSAPTATMAGRAEGRGATVTPGDGQHGGSVYGDTEMGSGSPRLRHSLSDYVETQRYRLDLGLSGVLDPQADDTVLGLRYSTMAPRQAVGDSTWARSLRGFARAAVWCLPAAVLLLAISSVVGWPTEQAESNLLSPGGWVTVTALGLALWVAGVVALAALVAAMPVRRWGLVAVVTSIVGTAMLSAIVGAVGLARPAISRTANAVENDPVIAEAASSMQARVLDHTTGRVLLAGGAILLAVGALALAFAVLGSRVLNRTDAWLIMLATVVAGVAAYLSWEFLLTLAAMVMLAATLGLAFTASRIAPDGTAPPAY
jgi:hypothetical protein